MSDEKPNRLLLAALKRAQDEADNERNPVEVRAAYRTIAVTYQADIANAELRRQARAITTAHEAAVRAAKKAQADG